MTDYEEHVLMLLSVIAMSTTVVALDSPKLDTAGKDKLSEIASTAINDTAAMVTASKERSAT